VKDELGFRQRIFFLKNSYQNFSIVHYTGDDSNAIKCGMFNVKMHTTISKKCKDEIKSNLDKERSNIRLYGQMKKDQPDCINNIIQMPYSVKQISNIRFNENNPRSLNDDFSSVEVLYINGLDNFIQSMKRSKYYHYHYDYYHY
jgi:hypothetical protein